ncbi:MAG: hypothetical protein AB1791_11630 [Chloroflexota bacterium]
MAISLIVHIANEDPVVCEVDEMPKPTDQVLLISNPRRLDGKDLSYLAEDVTTIILPWHRIHYVEILPSAELEEVIGFVRE